MTSYIKGMKAATVLAKPSPLQPLQKFTLFPNLPVELRLQIWNFVLKDEPRIIEISKHPTANRLRIRQSSFPILLHVCQESRNQAQKIYERVYIAGPNYFRVYYIDPAVDIEYYNIPGTIPASRPATSIEKICINAAYCTGPEAPWSEYACSLPKLREIIVVSEDNTTKGMEWPLALLDVDWENYPDNTNWRFRFNRFREQFEDVKFKQPEWKAPRVSHMLLGRGLRPSSRGRSKRASSFASLFAKGNIGGRDTRKADK